MRELHECKHPTIDRAYDTIARRKRERSMSWKEQRKILEALGMSVSENPWWAKDIYGATFAPQRAASDAEATRRASADAPKPADAASEDDDARIEAEREREQERRAARLRRFGEGTMVRISSRFLQDLLDGKYGNDSSVMGVASCLAANLLDEAAPELRGMNARQSGVDVSRLIPPDLDERGDVDRHGASQEPADRTLWICVGDTNVGDEIRAELAEIQEAHPVRPPRR
jgi:hypothetical protein